MQSRTKPKIVDRWIFAHRSLGELEDGEGSRAADARIEITVAIVKDLEELDSAPHATKAVEFVVSCADPEFRFIGTDVEALRQAAFAECESRFAIKWSEYFLVQVAARSPLGGLGAGMEFSYERVEKGVTWDGKELLRQREWRGDILIKPWPGRFKDRDGRVIACIEGTSANRAALEEFTRRIHELRRCLADTLKPEHIDHTLATLSSLALLPPDSPANAAGTE